MTNTYGLIAGISDTLYHADRTSLSSSGARKLLQCPARFKWDQDNASQSSSKALDMGKLAHTLVLGEGGPIVVVEAADWRSKAAQQQRAEAEADGALAVLAADMEDAILMREAVMKHDTARAIFESGTAELSGYWRDEPTDIQLRFRPDWMTTTNSGRVLCVDLKTTINADPAEFARSVARYQYHLQAAWYLAGLKAIGIEDPAFLFCAVEKTPPYCVSVIELDAKSTAEGERLMRRAVNLYARCLEGDQWPAFGPGISTISLPGYAFSRDMTEDFDIFGFGA